MFAPLLPLCSYTRHSPPEPIPTLPPPEPTPSTKWIPTEPTPPPPLHHTHTLTIPESDQRVGGSSGWGGCWFMCGGRVIQVGRGGSAWMGGGRRRPGWGGFKCGGGQRGKRWNEGCKGAKGQMLGGEVNEIFLHVEFRFKKGVGLSLTLQKFCITHLVKCESEVEKKSNLIWFFTCFIIHYNGFQMNYNALSFCQKKN